jgi:transposase
LPEVVQPYGRKTLRLEQVFIHLGFVSGGEEGARTSRRLNILISADSILRRIRRNGSAPQGGSRVVGIDEFAFRKGHRYGTILVDLEKRKPVDLLPNRDAETVARWLHAHPEIEIISRDRSGTFKQAANLGAPQARQVVDRWHLLKNMGETLARVVENNSKAVKEASELEDASPVAVAAPVKEQDASMAKRLLNKKAEDKAGRRERRLGRYDAVMQLHQEGVGIREIVRRLGISRGTVRRFLMAEEFPEIAPRGSTLLDPYRSYLLGRWNSGCLNATQLWREIVEKGYGGGAGMIRKFIAKLKPTGKKSVTAPERKPSGAPSPRQVVRILSKDVKFLDVEQQEYVNRLAQLSPELLRASDLVKRFIGIVKDRDADQLDEWLKDMEGSNIKELKAFASGLYQDRDAVEAALQMEWSNGQVEGHVNRLKAIKRQMYGRGNFDLLRHRVLHAVA